MSKNKKYMLVNVILTVMVVVAVIAFISFVSQLFSCSRDYVRSDESLWYSVESGDYSDLVIATEEIRNRNIKTTDLYEQCFSVADYFDAASHYKVKSELGKTEEALEYRRKMEEAAEKLKDHQDVVDDINDKLDIE